MGLKTEPSNSGEVGLRENSEPQGNRACCSPWGRQESGMTQRLNNNNRFCFREIKPDGNVLSLVNEI